MKDGPVKGAIRMIAETFAVNEIVNSAEEADTILTEDATQALYFLQDFKTTKVVMTSMPNEKAFRSAAASLKRLYPDRVKLVSIFEPNETENQLITFLTKG